MNKALFDKVKAKSKDTRLSEKYLKEITETLGDNIEDDSTDEEAIEATATRIATVAKSSQGEATRWAQKAKTKPSKDSDDDGDDDSDDSDDDAGKGNKGGKKGKGSKTDDDKDRIAELERKYEQLVQERAKGERSAVINSAMEKHGIPKYLRERLAKSISDDEDVDAAVSQIKQDLITDGLTDDKPSGAKAASEKQVGEAANSLLESITVK